MRLCKCNSILVLVCSSVLLVLVPFSSFLSCEPLLRLPQLQFEVLADPSHHHYPAATAPLKSSKCKLQTQTQQQKRKFDCFETSREMDVLSDEIMSRVWKSILVTVLMTASHLYQPTRCPPLTSSDSDARWKKYCGCPNPSDTRGQTRQGDAIQGSFSGALNYPQRWPNLA